jgi:hypothetical protein
MVMDFRAQPLGSRLRDRALLSVHLARSVYPPWERFRQRKRWRELNPHLPTHTIKVLAMMYDVK